MKITVCDICYNEGKLTETTRYMSVKGNRNLKLDYCPKCKSKIPKNIRDYIRFVYKIRFKEDIDDKAIDLLLKR